MTRQPRQLTDSSHSNSIISYLVPLAVFIYTHRHLHKEYRGEGKIIQLILRRLYHNHSLYSKLLSSSSSSSIQYNNRASTIWVRFNNLITKVLTANNSSHSNRLLWMLFNNSNRTETRLLSRGDNHRTALLLRLLWLNPQLTLVSLLKEHNSLRQQEVESEENTVSNKLWWTSNTRISSSRLGNEHFNKHPP